MTAPTPAEREPWSMHQGHPVTRTIWDDVKRIDFSKSAATRWVNVPMRAPLKWHDEGAGL